MCRFTPLGDVQLCASGHHLTMDAKTHTGARRSTPGDRSAHNGDYQHRHDAAGPGIDLPIVGHLEYKSAGFLAGLGIAGAVGVLEWPVVAAVAIGYALSRQE
jgi:hypothetical protein